MPYYPPASGGGGGVVFYLTLPVSGSDGDLAYDESDNSLYMWVNGFWAFITTLPVALIAENGDFLLTESGANLIL